MSIAITGPKKYDFQDIACVGIGLRFLTHPDAELIGEPEGGEDGEITWTKTPGYERQCIEIQVKGAEGICDISDFADFLMHFPERKSKNTLIERLLNDKNRTALFVLSARTTDVLQPLLLSPNWSENELINGRDDNLTALATRLKLEFHTLAEEHAISVSAMKKSTRLNRERVDNLRAVAQITEADLMRGLSQVAILDTQTKEQTDIRLQVILREKYRIASDRLRDGLARLATALKDSKDTRANALMDFREILAELGPDSLVSPEYLLRGREQELLSILADKRSVFLSGPPQIGKTWTARWLAGQLQTLGFEVQSGSDVGQAERYLTNSVTSERAFVLDDPLGERTLSAKAGEAVQGISSLLKRMPHNCRLIVAQVQEPIMNYYRKTSLADCNLDGMRWQSLSESNVQFALDIWNAAAIRHDVPSEIKERIHNLVRRDTTLRAPGALEFLASQASSFQRDINESEILLRAHASATSLGRTLATTQPGMEEMLVSLAIATDASTGVKQRDLAFVMSKAEEAPGIVAHDYTAVSIGADLSGVGVVMGPKYLNEYALDSQMLHARSVLEKYQFLETRMQKSNFTHPYFRAAAQQLVSPNSTLAVDILSERVQKALACLSATTSAATARNLHWITALLKDTDHHHSAPIALAIFGLRSIFPSTRDICFEYLMSNVNYLTEKQLNEIPHWTHRVQLDLEEIVDFEGDAIIQSGDLGAGYWERAFGSVNVTAVEPYIAAIEAEQVIDLGIELTRNLCNLLNAEPERLTSRLCKYLFSSDISAVRAIAAKLWFSAARDSSTDDADICERVRLDRNPSVTVAVLHGTVHCWSELTKFRKDEIRKILHYHLSSPGAATAAFLQLVLFDREEIFGKNPPWDLFGFLVPAAMKLLPSSVTFDNGRLMNALDHAIAGGDAKSFTPIFIEWIDRLEKMDSSESHGLSDYDLSIIPQLLKVTADDPDGRSELISRLLKLLGTGARMTFVADLTDGWDQLKLKDRGLIISMLQKRDADTIWLRAAALIREKIPLEMQNAILGPAEMLIENASAETLIHLLGDEVVNACVDLYTSRYGVFSRIGLSGHRSVIMKTLIKGIVNIPNHSRFEAAFRRAYSEKNLDDINRVILAASSEKLEQIFSIMLDLKINENANWAASAWNALFERSKEENLFDNWLYQLRDAAPAILTDITEPYSWLNHSDNAQLLVDSLCEDKLIYMFMNVLKGMDLSTPEMSDILANFMKIVRGAPPKLRRTWEVLRNNLKTFSSGQEYLAEIDEGVRRATTEGHDLERNLRQKYATYRQPDSWKGL